LAHAARGEALLSRRGFRAREKAGGGGLDADDGRERRVGDVGESSEMSGWS
jgi:hypothetical protein